MAKKQRAALICRVSTPQQIKLGLESQVAVLKRRAIKDGYEVPDSLIFQEQISGLDAKKDIRKSLKDLMDAVEEKKVDVCYTYELTRISRDPYNLVERVKWFSDRMIPMYIYDAELWTLDRKTKEEVEETTEYIFGAATYGKVEAKKMKMRTMRARNEVAKEGLYVGHLSDGYCVVETERGKEIRIDEDRRKVIERIFDLYVKGNSISKITEILNTEGVPTASKYRFNSPKFKGYQETFHRKGSEVPLSRIDAKWQYAVVSQYLRNKWYVGERQYNKATYYIEPIIKAEQWSVVSAMLQENNVSFRSKKESTTHTYLLSRLIYCGKCGKRMYGHYTGLNNHYYCSSLDESVKCGLKGVNKENIEAAVAIAVKKKGSFDIIGGKEGVVGGFFKLSPQEEKKIKEEIKTNNTLIDEYDKKSDELDRNYAEAVKQTVLHANDKKRVAIYESMIRDIEDERANIDNKKLRLTQKNILNSKKLNAKSNVDKILQRLVEENNLSTLKELFLSVIEKVIVYNLTNIINVIRVRFIDGQYEDFIYSYPLMKQRIIIITNGLVQYDEKENALKCKEAPCVLTYGKDISYDDFIKMPADKKKKEYGVEGKDYFVIPTEIVSAKEIIRCLRNDDAVAIPFERLELLSDKGKEQNAKYKLWRKKYNTGLPTCVPYVVKDETYKGISIQRKHLYNRKNKIKMHKKLSVEEKEMRMAEIDKELALLKAKVRYMNREEAVREYRKNKDTVVAPPTILDDQE